MTSHRQISRWRLYDLVKEQYKNPNIGNRAHRRKIMRHVRHEMYKGLKAAGWNFSAFVAALASTMESNDG